MKVPLEELGKLDELGKLPDWQIAKRYGYSRFSIFKLRKRNGIAPYVKPGAKLPIDELGKQSDRELAKRHGYTAPTVSKVRKKYGIPKYKFQPPVHSRPAYESISWTPDVIALLGTVSDRAMAKMLKCPARLICQKRKSLGIGYNVSIQAKSAGHPPH